MQVDQALQLRAHRVLREQAAPAEVQGELAAPVVELLFLQALQVLERAERRDVRELGASLEVQGKLVEVLQVPERVERHEVREPELKGSIGEGPNHSNFSDQSSVKIVSEFRKIC